MSVSSFTSTPIPNSVYIELYSVNNVGGTDLVSLKYSANTLKVPPNQLEDIWASQSCKIANREKAVEDRKEKLEAATNKQDKLLHFLDTAARVTAIGLIAIVHVATLGVTYQIDVGFLGLSSRIWNGAEGHAIIKEEKYISFLKCGLVSISTLINKRNTMTKNVIDALESNKTGFEASLKRVSEEEKQFLNTKTKQIDETIAYLKEHYLVNVKEATS